MASSFSGRVPLKETVAMERCMFRLPDWRHFVGLGELIGDAFSLSELLAA
jgi:hypothetical protein